MIRVPDEFRPVEKHRYPADNLCPFEEWYAQNHPPDVNGREYLGVMWTGYYKNHSYGNDKAAIERLQGWLDSLPTDKKYYAVCQYDNGPLNDLSHLDVKLFCMSGGPEGFIPIPLVCSPHPYKFPEVEKDILCSFIGRLTDPIRNEIVMWGNGRKDCYVTAAPHPLEAYCKILARSKFVLAPRGFGPSSFRVCEALQYGAMPFLFGNHGDVIFETKVLLFFQTYSDWYDPDHHHDLEKYLTEKQKEIDRSHIGATYSMFYTFGGVRSYIIHQLTYGDTLHS